MMAPKCRKNPVATRQSEGRLLCSRPPTAAQHTPQGFGSNASCHLPIIGASGLALLPIEVSPIFTSALICGRSPSGCIAGQPLSASSSRRAQIARGQCRNCVDIALRGLFSVVGEGEDTDDRVSVVHEGHGSHATGAVIVEVDGLSKGEGFDAGRARNVKGLNSNH